MAKHIFVRALLIGASALAFSAPAFAQDKPAADDSDVIIVTAQNREQKLTDVPIAIDVVKGEDLKRTGFSDLNDIDKIAPVVQINQDQGTVKITLRGVGTTDGGEAQDTSVVVDIDGEYLNRPNVMGMSLFDMERVEVLRGPQGTLYGRNSTGGAINFITRKPAGKWGFDGRVSYGNYNTVRVDAGVEAPFGDMGGARVSGFYESRDGYVSHPAGGGFFVFPAFPAGRSDDNKAYGARISGRIKSDEGLTIDLAGEFARREFTPQAFATVDLTAAGKAPTVAAVPANSTCSSGPGFTQVAPAYVSAAGGNMLMCVPSGTNYLAAVDRSAYDAPIYGLGKVIENTMAVRGRIAYQISDNATVTYTGGYRTFHGDPNNFLTLPVVYRSYNLKDNANTQSHELRLNGKIGEVIYQLGGFYFKESQDRENGFFLPGVAFTGILGNPAYIGTPGGFLSYFGRKLDSSSKSVFGQVEVPLTSSLTLTGGLRYTDDNRSALFTNVDAFRFVGFPVFALVEDPYIVGVAPTRKQFDLMKYVTRIPLKVNDSKVTWLAGVSYKPSDRTLVFAKVSTGFKAGGFDAVGNYKPETNTAYEIGWKQSFGSAGQHHVNLGAFYYNYKDLQVSVLLDTSIGGQTFNAGKATIWGLEASGDFQLGPNTRLHGSVNYLRSKYDQLNAQYAVFCLDVANPARGRNPCPTGIGDLDPTVAGNQFPDFKGNSTPFAPRLIVTAGIEQVFHIGDGTLTGRVDTIFKSKYFTDYFNFSDGTQKRYTQTDVSLEYKPGGRHFSIQGFARNLEDNRPLTYGSFIAAGPDRVFNWQFGTPRTYGVRVGVDF